MSYSKYYNQMPDGTIKQLNPFTGTEVWSVPGRGNKPLTNEVPKTARKLENLRQVRDLSLQGEKGEDFCAFCEAKYFETPPEKSRVIFEPFDSPAEAGQAAQGDKYEKLDFLSAEDYFKTVAEFRRVPNLFEIVTIDYWRKNFDFRLNSNKKEWKEKYLSTPLGHKHVMEIVNAKLKASGKSEEDIKKLSEEDKIYMADSFFGGAHELIIARRHYKKDAVWDADLCASGDLTPEEHCEYLKFTIETMEDIFHSNRYVRYISVFQNWLKPAGASFDHLHKQLVGLDEWGNTIEEQTEMVRKDANIFNNYGANLHAMMNLVVAENDFAIAYSGIGHRFPTLEIFSKSAHSSPSQHTQEELKGFSDLVHACHAASGNQISCNEEWYYTPIDSIYKMPWHILIKWRLNVTAGFEGGTKIYINPISPVDLRDKVVPRLYKLREEQKIAKIRIAEECKIVHNPLQYYKGET
jgi:galactose-1-phosphate uridylyltransferase